MKIVFLEKENLGDDLDFSIFDEFGDVVFYDSTNDHELPERVKDAQVLVLNKIPMNEETLQNASDVQLICVTATGVNNIDFTYTRRRGITVTNVENYSTATVAQHTFALYFYLAEKLRYYDDYVKSGDYIKSALFTHIGRKFHDLSGSTWGIAGLGNIGSAVARIAVSFGCRVIYYSSSGKNNNSEYERVEFEELLKQSDVISVHAPLNQDTERLFDYSAFQKMKSSAIFLNLGRGPIVAEEDLARALLEREIAGAGLDVLSREPMAKDNPLARIKDSDRLIITPHIAWASVEARQRLLDAVYQNMKNCLRP